MSLKILQGDWIEKLREIESESIQTCVTSPPYWGLRNYGVDGQIGIEDTPERYVDKLVSGFREVKRTLKDDGTLWLNLGDCYCGGGNNRGNNSPLSDKQSSNGGATGQCSEHAKNIRKIEGIKTKDLVGVPWMVAFALRGDGWYLRCDIIWHKPNPMPESVTDRPTRAHEYIFLMSKSRTYYYDYERIKESQSEGTFERYGNGDTIPSFNKYGGSDRKNESFCASTPMAILPNGRNKRSVWKVPPAAYPEAHFATFPPDLIRPCILAGSRPGDTVLYPFCGSGTTGKVSIERGRNFIGIELNPEYIDMAMRRCAITPGLPL